MIIIFNLSDILRYNNKSLLVPGKCIYLFLMSMHIQFKNLKQTSQWQKETDSMNNLKTHDILVQ